MSRLPLNNLAHAAAMAQHVPQWLIQQNQEWEQACANLRAIARPEYAEKKIKQIQNDSNGDFELAMYWINKVYNQVANGYEAKDGQ